MANSVATEDALVAGWIGPEGFRKISVAFHAAGVQGSLFYAVGRPGAAVASADGIDGAVLTSYAGQIPWHNPGAGSSFIGHAHLCSTAFGVWKLLDRFWHNSGIVVTTTTAQAINSATWPARSRGGNTNGNGVFVGLEVLTTLGNGSPITNTTLGYTNEVGTVSHVGTIASIPAGAVAGSFFPFDLQAGDYGVRKVTGITLGTSYVSGSVSLVAFRPLMMGSVTAANIGETQDPVTGGFPKCWDNTVPFLVWTASGTAAITVAGQIVVTQG